MKVCTTCKVAKSLECFNKDSTNTDGHEYGCRECRGLRRRETYKKNAEVNKVKSRDKSRNFRRTRKEWSRNYDLKRNYGITTEQYLEMLKEQDYKCKICLTSDPKGRHKQFAVDHCHKAGHIRGLLCNACNVGLGSFRDSIDSLQNAINYLKKEKT